MQKVDLYSKAGKKIIERASHVSMPWMRGPWPHYNKDAKAHYADSGEDLAHELAHFLVAPKYRRDQPYFGLGSPALMGDFEGLSPRTVGAEEAMASMLGIGLLAEAGVKSVVLLDILGEHNWEETASIESLLSKPSLVRNLRSRTRLRLKQLQGSLYREWHKRRHR